ncbi:MAG: hypothetical protein KatS3mg097_489 [Candidatus Parcubacteria bacterium]|nr:MAG: hypothetical protein KatS3mg097_489 [Candidatus Parcubacteria bacterium]
MKYQNLEDFKKEQGYYIDNVWYPRVTKICDVKNKPGLYYFYGQALSFQHANLQKQKAADEGKIVHELIESFISHRSVIVPEEYQGIHKAFTDFLRNHSFFSKMEWLEKRIKHDGYRYAGTFDIIGELDGYFALIDIKTSSAVYDDYRLQTSAYFWALREEPWLLTDNGRKIVLPREIEKRYILRINQKRICEKCGVTMKVRKIGDKIEGNNNCEHKFGELIGEWELKEFNGHEEDFKGFLHCKGLWEWEYRDYLKEIGYL